MEQKHPSAGKHLPAELGRQGCHALRVSGREAEPGAGKGRVPAVCSHLRGWSCASQEAARAGSHAQIPAEGLQQAPGPALNLGSLCRRGAEGFWSARGTRWVLRGQNQTNISWSSKRQHTNLQISILWHQEAGPPWLRQMKTGGVTSRTIPEVTAATLGLFTLQGKSGSVKSLVAEGEE